MEQKGDITQNNKRKPMDFEQMIFHDINCVSDPFTNLQIDKYKGHTDRMYAEFKDNPFCVYYKCSKSLCIYKMIATVGILTFEEKTSNACSEDVYKLELEFEAFGDFKNGLENLIHKFKKEINSEHKEYILLNSNLRIEDFSIYGDSYYKKLFYPIEGIMTIIK
jgi:hypothetical protein